MNAGLKLRKKIKRCADKCFREYPLENFWKVDDKRKKKILIIPSSYPIRETPIVGSFFQEQSLLMADEYDVRILYAHPKQFKKNQWFFYEKTNILHDPDGLSFYYKKINSICDEKEEVKRIFWSYETVLNELLKIGWRPDVIHAHSVIYGGIIANRLGKKFKIPVMITEHMMFLLHTFSKFVQGEVFDAYQSASRVTPPSHDKKRAILMHGIKCEPIVVGNMVDDCLFDIPKIKKRGDVFDILIVAGSSYIKDLPTFFRAVREITNRGHKNIHATIVGNGVWGNENYKDYVKKIGIEEYCTFVDVVSRKDMPKYYHNCDVFVSSSIAEGFQVSVLEAMACGKPIISTKNGGVEDGLTADSGILVDVHDFNAIADAVIKVKNKELLFDSEKIRRMVVEKYGKEAFKKRIAKIYNEIIDENRK